MILHCPCFHSETPCVAKLQEKLLMLLCTSTLQNRKRSMLVGILCILFPFWTIYLMRGHIRVQQYFGLNTFNSMLMPVTILSAVSYDHGTYFSFAVISIGENYMCFIIDGMRPDGLELFLSFSPRPGQYIKVVYTLAMSDGTRNVQQPKRKQQILILSTVVHVESDSVWCQTNRVFRWCLSASVERV